MAVLCNNVIAGASIAEEAVDDGTYKIEKSLRFNAGDDPVLSRQHTTNGNRKTYTISFWLKRGPKHSNGNYFLGQYGDGAGVELQAYFDDSTDQIVWYYDPSNYVKTTAKFRDHSAWYHIVFAVDTTSPRSGDRIKVYINGESQTFETYNAPTQNANTDWNCTAGEARIGASRSGTARNHYIADFQSIDGLQLHASAFGTRDSSGVWNPKAFSIPQINDGTVWSTPSYWSGTEKSDAPYDYAFDGHLGSSVSGTSATIAKIDNSSTTGFVNYNFTPPNPITFVDKVEVCGGISSVRYSINHESYVNGANTGDWQTIASGGGTITTINIEADNHYPEFRGFRVDGVVLLDGVTDRTTRNNPNIGASYNSHSQFTMGGGQAPSNPGNSFDGSTGTYGGHSSNSWFTFTPTSAISFNDKVEVWIQGHGDTNAALAYSFNHSSVSYESATPSWAAANKNTWTTVATGGGTFTKVSCKNSDSSTGGIRLYAVRVDGHVLVDSTVDNSFHLKFNDTSRDKSLGKDSLNGKIDDATGGLPILTTTDDYGEVKGSGNRTDSLSGNLKLAIAGDSVSSTAMDLSSADHDVTVDGVTTSTDESRLYGSSLKFVSSDTHRLTVEHADMAFGTGDFCVEFWVYNKTNKNYNAYVSTRETANNTEAGWVIASNANGYLYVHSNNALGGSYSSEHKLPLTTWCHVAYTRASGKHRLFLNGVAAATSSTLSRNYTEDKLCIGDNGYSQDEPINAYMQDIRVYKGAAKYTANFTPPNRNDFGTVTNLSTAPHGTVYDAPGTWTGGGVNKNGDGMFNGITNSGYYQPNSTSTTSDWAPATAISGTTFKLYTTHGNSGLLKVNNTSVTSVNGGWTDISSAANGSLTSIKLGPSGAGSVWIRAWALEVDGVMITNQPHSDLDVLTDTPTNYGTESNSAVGGELRGNYCTLNSIVKGTNLTLKNGNLEYLGINNGAACSLGTFGMSSGRWYWEDTKTGGSGTYGTTGIALGSKNVNEQPGETGGYAYNQSGEKWNSGSNSAYGDSYTTNDTVGIAFDADNGACWFSKNGVWQNTDGSSNSATVKAQIEAGTTTNAPFTGLTDGPYFPCGGDLWAEGHFNFGQRPFKNAAPEGFKTLCTQNLDDTFSGDELNNPSKYFDTTIWTGTGEQHDIFFDNPNPNLVWIKERDSTGDHHVFDRIRGVTKAIRTNVADAEVTDANELTNYYSDGIRLGSGGDVNASTTKTVGWCWSAGTAGAANNDGSTNIASPNQWKDATAGFSITKYTGNGASRTIGHGLGAKPDFWITKDLDESRTHAWRVWHTGLSGMNYRLELDESDAEATSSTSWDSTAPTNTVFSLGADDNTNKSGNDYIMYCWTAIPGYSAFGSYEGNGDADGPFVYTGFRPKYILYKNADTSGRNWFVHDSERSPTNGGVKYVQPSTSSAEGTNIGGDLDLLSNGFKWRTSNNDQNNSGDTFIYACFAEHPFKTARAR